LWDRKDKAPAIINGRLAVGLTPAASGTNPGRPEEILRKGSLTNPKYLPRVRHIVAWHSSRGLQRRFKILWARIGIRLTDADIARAFEYAEQITAREKSRLTVSVRKKPRSWRGSLLVLAGTARH
jgi:hypothetical protein